MKVSEEVFDKLIAGRQAEFLKEGWLRKSEEVVNNQDAIHNFYWGPRAITTISTLVFFFFLGMIYNLVF